MTRCPNCGASVASGRAHCAICGRATTVEASSPAALHRTNYGDTRFKICPRCRAHHPFSAEVCSCGHRFVTEFPELQAATPPPEPQPTAPSPAPLPRPSPAPWSGLTLIFAVIGVMTVIALGQWIFMAGMSHVRTTGAYTGSGAGFTPVRADGNFAQDMTTREAQIYLTHGTDRQSLYAVFGDPASHGYQQDTWTFRDGTIEVVYDNENRYAFHNTKSR